MMHDTGVNGHVFGVLSDSYRTRYWTLKSPRRLHLQRLLIIAIGFVGCMYWVRKNNCIEHVLGGR